MIHFHTKRKGVQITFEKFTTNFYFDNSEDGMKMKIVIFESLLA